jgi:hypothetical protein
MQTATYFQKLWDKGIDISASVVTAMIVGAIGLLLWKGKLWLDLRAEEAKQRQKFRLDDERAGALRESAAMERDHAMRCEFEEIVSDAELAPNMATQRKVWERYLGFMGQYDLDRLPANAATLPARTILDKKIGSMLRNGAPRETIAAKTLVRAEEVRDLLAGVFGVIDGLLAAGL